MTSCVHTRTPCVCVYSPTATTGVGEGGIEQIATRRRVCADTHTYRTLSRSFVLFCKGASLHTHTPHSVHSLCTLSGGGFGG